MLFDTPVYFLFLTFAVLVYWRLGFQNQNRFLLALSYFFYGWWDWRFLLLMVLSTVVDYTLAIRIADSRDPRRRKLLLTLSMVMNFGFLGFFKYCNFFLDSTVGLLSALGVQGVPVQLLQIVLPPGISFYTFQEVAYIVDVYFGRLPASRSLTHYALFISLFPHLIAGPIQRPSHLLPQVQKPRTFSSVSFFHGLMLIATGLFRKCVIADNCATLANAAFDGRLGTGGWSLVIGVLAFGWQIYGDFSGYSDLARGSAQLLGFHFMVNFRQPYLSVTLQEFWRRWHISLSTWLRDYLYIPLGGSRRGPGRTYGNLMATMLLGGLWHGANWTFVIWGGIHGGFLALERWVDGRGVMGVRWLWRLVTLTVVGVAWVFFRAQSVGEAMRLLGGLGEWSWAGRYGTGLAYLGGLTVLALGLDLVMERQAEVEHPVERWRPEWQAGFAVVLMLVLMVFGANETNAFLYFQF